MDNGIAAAEQVFGIELLLDKILLFALRHGENVDWTTAKACKLVNSSWLNRVNPVLRKAGSAFVTLTAAKISKVVEFTLTFGDCPASSIPPFRLIIQSSWYTQAFTGATLTICLECLRRCGNGLVGFEIACENTLWQLSASEEKSLFSPHPLRLPSLHTFVIRVEGHANGEDAKVLQSIVYMQNFVHKILESCSSLRRFRLLCDGEPLNRPVWTIDVKCLKLPPSLQEVTFRSQKAIKELGLECALLKNSLLRNLTSLSLALVGGEGSDLQKTVVIILDALRQQLRKLNFDRSCCCDKSEEIVPISGLPVMPWLKEFSCCGWTHEGLSRATPVLQTSFPGLKKFSCKEVSLSPSAILAWVEADARCVSVEELDIAFPKPKGEGSFESERQIHWEKMSRLSSAFLNITCLKLSFWNMEQQTAGMKVVFQKLTQLQMLETEVKKYEYQASTYVYNAHLLGTSPQEVRLLHSDIGDLFHEEVQFDVPSSIVNLQELRKLHLSLNTSCCYLDVAVKFGISKMPKLVDFTFSKELTIKATPGRIQRWRNHHRAAKSELCSTSGCSPAKVFCPSEKTISKYKQRVMKR